MFFWILNTKKIRRLVKSVLRWGFHGKKQIEIMFFSFFLVFEVNQKYLLLYVFCKLIFRAPKSMLLHIMTCQLRLSVISILQVNLDELVTAYVPMYYHLWSIGTPIYAKISNPHMQRYKISISYITVCTFHVFFMHQTNNSLKKRLLSDFLVR